MPSLRALDMRLPPSKSDVTFPALGFTGITHISTCALPLPNINSAQLSHLSLERQEPEQRPSLKLFLEFPKANPSLEMLRLNDAGPVLSMKDLKDLGYPLGLLNCLTFIASSIKFRKPIPWLSRTRFIGFWLA